MHRNQEGFTLPEILIGLAISSIIIAASFASYIVIKQNYDFQKDMKNISQTSRAVATMIMRDVRMAGYNYDDGPTKQKPEITIPIKITDGGTTAPDSIEIIYDKSYTERLKISYYTKTYNNRLRVYKKVEKCNAMNCATSSLQTVIAESPIADYVDDLQFTGSKNGNALGTGAIKFGEGNLRWITPRSITSSGSHIVGQSPNNLFDGNLDTFHRGTTSNNWMDLVVYFNNPVRVTKIVLSTAAHLDGGSLGSDLRYPYKTASYPYGTNYHVMANGFFRVGKADATCAWSSPCTPFSSADMNFNCAGQIGEIDTLNASGSNGCDLSGSNHKEFGQNAVKVLYLKLGASKKCSYTGTGQLCNPTAGNTQVRELAEVQFFGEVYGEPQDPQEVEIGLLIRSPEEHGTSPVAQTFNLGNRPVVTNDNYIRDSYTISALVRNKFYD
jgi:prepilin-type N-terminal cleavage/methylation domain-containing protein